MRRLIVVTGGSKGIGRAVINKFMAEGFDAVTCSRNQVELASLKEEMEKSYPGSKLIFSRADLSKKEEVIRFGEFVSSIGRPVDVLVNNAGVFTPGEITTEPDGNLELMINANLYSAYHLTRSIAVEMKRRKQGHIFNMCSIASIKAYSNGGSYAISKFALLGFSKCLREELKSFEIRVTAVMPGATFTQSWAGSGLPESRFMTAEDIALAVYSAHAMSAGSVVEEIIIRPQQGDI